MTMIDGRRNETLRIRSFSRFDNKCPGPSTRAPGPVITPRAFAYYLNRHIIIITSPAIPVARSRPKFTGPSSASAGLEQFVRII